MENLRNKAKRLAETPLGDTNISVRLARSLSRAGYKTLEEAFDEYEPTIKDVVGRDFSEFTKLVDAYFENPMHFVSLMSQERQKPVERPIPSAQGETNKAAPERVDGKSRDRRYNYVHESSLTTPYGEFLKSNQQKAKAVFDDLCDRHDTVLIYQAFPAFSVELEDIRESFLKLFSDYKARPGKALDISEQFLPDLFLIFVADLARDSFADDNLWGNFSKTLPLNQNTLNDLKKRFVDLLEKRGMPLYAQGEAAAYYFYTVLLHGGLSEESWEYLWKCSLMPLAKELRSGSVGFGGEIDGNTILKELKRDGGKYAPKKESVIRMLQKAPDFTIAPLFEAALKAAVQIETNRLSRSEYVLVESFDLPEAAIVALHEVTEKKSSSRSSAARCAGRGQANTLKQYVSLPSADLCLDLEQGVVSVKWAKKQYPAAFLGDKIDFYIDGVKLHEQRFEMKLNKCILDDVEITVQPQARYDLELRLMKRTEGDGCSFEQKSSLGQSFQRSKPGCFEFIRGIDRTYHLRSRNDRITRRRRIAYVLKDGFYIVPGTGMTPVEKYESGEEWSGTSIFVYDVDPGASGSIFKKMCAKDDEEVAVWQESYRAHINKRRIIGETLGGLDLFGYVYCRDGGNAGLPKITIEAADGEAAFRDLDIICTCNGEPFYVPREVVWEDDFGASRTRKIALPLERASRIDWHSEEVEIVARQISAGGKVVFRYRFAIVPIQQFRLDEAHVENGIVVASYSFSSRLNIRVTDPDGTVTEVRSRGDYSKRMLLKDEFLPLTIESEDGSRRVDAKLALAALDVSIPEGIAAISRKRPVCLADAISLGISKGEITIRAIGWRYNRVIYALAGLNALCIKELKQPAVVSFNLFAAPKMFVPNSTEPRDINMMLSVGYGDIETPGGVALAWTDAQLLRCREGIGVKDYQLVPREGSLYLRFDKPVHCNASVLFKRIGRRAKDLFEVPLAKDSSELAIPDEVASLIHTQKEVAAVLAPKSRMGKPRYEYSFEVPLKG